MVQKWRMQRSSGNVPQVEEQFGDSPISGVIRYPVYKGWLSDVAERLSQKEKGMNGAKTQDRWAYQWL